MVLKFKFSRNKIHNTRPLSYTKLTIQSTGPQLKQYIKQSPLTRIPNKIDIVYPIPPVWPNLRRTYKMIASMRSFVS